MFTLIPIEKFVLKYARQQGQNEADALEAQASLAQVSQRKNTGHGLQSHLWVPPGLPKLRSGNLNGPFLQIKGIDHVVMFTVFVHEGFIDLIDGSTIADTDNLDFNKAVFDLSVANKSR